jgi:DNA-binding NarL/FixJ family response regulator
MTAGKVLVIDDSDLVRDVTQFSLEKHGYEVATLADPHGLADALARERPDVVLVDIGFPGLRVAELARLVRPHAKSCPFLVFSDRSPEELAAHVAELDAVGSIPKGADGGALAAAVGPHVRRT